MTKCMPSLFFASSLFALAIVVDSAQAQSRVFVAAQGSDSNPCTFALPCRTFQHAHNVVVAGGEIDVLDPAGYGALVITKAISIQGHDFSGVTVPAGGNGITVTASPVDKITLRGLIIEGAGVGSLGILFTSGRSLTIESCVVRNLIAAGIGIAPATSSRIVVSNTLVADNGGHGIYVQPSPGPTLQVSAVFNRVEAYNNFGKGIGIYGNNTLAGAKTVAIAVDSVVGYNGESGYYALGGGGFTLLSVFRSTSFYNGSSGILADSGAQIAVSQSNLEQDSWMSGGGIVYSYGDNYTGGSSVPSGLISKN